MSKINVGIDKKDVQEAKKILEAKKKELGIKTGYTTNQQTLEFVFDTFFKAIEK